MRLLTIVLLALGFSISSIAASYEVPGFENGVAIYDMKFKLRQKDSTYRAKYSLPLDLTGVKNEIDVSGSFNDGGLLVLKGDNAILECDMSQKMCHAIYKNLVIDAVQVKARLEAQGLSPEMVQIRLSVTDQFGGEPIGIIYFE